jgi:hypothetical protein
MTLTTERKQRTYGGPRRPASPGIGPLKLIPSVALMAGLAFAMLLTLAVGFFRALAVAAVWVLLFVPIVWQRDGRPVATGWIQRRLARRAARRKLLSYRSGLAGVAGGTRRLPGLLAGLEAWNCSGDALGRPFVMVEIPAARQWAVVFRVDPGGGAMVDQDSIDIQVAYWGELLAMVGRTGGIRQVAAVVETQPNTGALLVAHGRRLVVPGAPEFARQVVAASCEELPHDVASTIGFVAVTYVERELGIKPGASRRERAGAAADAIGRRMPELTGALARAGATRPRPMGLYDLTQRLSEAFDPASALPNAELVAAGTPPEIRWEDCGPTAADPTATTYWHDSGVSRTWEALKVPSGVFTEDVLRELVGPDVEAPRKRVTMLYHPIDSAHAPEIVDRDIRTAVNRAQRRKGHVHAHDQVGVRVAEQAAQEEAAGAGVTQLSVLVTAALGVGLVLPDLALVPESLRTHL